MILKYTKKILILFCIIFTFATLISCIINLALGYETDTYIHILDRAVLTLIGSIAFTLIQELNPKSKVLGFLYPYGASILLAMLYVYISGLYQELHQNAYRDVFLNFTIVFIVVYCCQKAYEKIRKKRQG